MFSKAKKVKRSGADQRLEAILTLIMLIIIIWLLRWLFNCGALNSSNSCCTALNRFQVHFALFHL